MRRATLDATTSSPATDIAFTASMPGTGTRTLAATATSGRLAIALVALACAACGDNSDHGEAVFAWDTRAPGAYRIDGLAPDDGDIHALIDDRATDDAVAMFYGHYRPDGVGGFDAATLDALMARAVAADLPFLTFADLAAGPPRRGVCISIDDDQFAAWTTLRPLFAQYGARITFFVTRYPYTSDDDKAQLHTLAADGHDIEAHSIDHPDANAYVAANGLDAFLADQVEPSFDVLRADGYAPTSYAHPFGATSPEIDAAILDLPGVSLVRRITAH